MAVGSLLLKILSGEEETSKLLISGMHTVFSFVASRDPCCLSLTDTTEVNGVHLLKWSVIQMSKRYNYVIMSLLVSLWYTTCSHNIVIVLLISLQLMAYHNNGQEDSLMILHKGTLKVTLNDITQRSKVTLDWNITSGPQQREISYRFWEEFRWKSFDPPPQTTGIPYTLSGCCRPLGPLLHIEWPSGEQWLCSVIREAVIIFMGNKYNMKGLCPSWPARLASPCMIVLTIHDGGYSNNSNNDR